MYILLCHPFWCAWLVSWTTLFWLRYINVSENQNKRNTLLMEYLFITYNLVCKQFFIVILENTVRDTSHWKNCADHFYFCLKNFTFINSLLFQINKKKKSNYETNLSNSVHFKLFFTQHIRTCSRKTSVHKYILTTSVFKIIVFKKKFVLTLWQIVVLQPKVTEKTKKNSS